MGRPGATRITVADRSIEFTPEESRSGTIVTVSGVRLAGIQQRRRLQRHPVCGIRHMAAMKRRSVNTTPDSDGNFTADIKVPLNAKIPSTNEVRVSYVDDSR